MRQVCGLVGVLLALVVFSGCTSISRQTVLTPCSDAQCPVCRGTKTHRCEECLGRASVPCRACKGLGTVTCTNCGGDGVKNGLKCGCALGGGPVGRKMCPLCNGTRFEQCPTCRGKGMVACGTTSYVWVCRKCGARYDYPAEACTRCAPQ